jgi:hypothetical protein
MISRGHKVDTQFVAALIVGVLHPFLANLHRINHVMRLNYCLSTRGNKGDAKYREYSATGGKFAYIKRPE